MTGWLSTCSVAFPPLRVNRTTWYLPSLTITALSSMIMSSVPTLKITPIFPRSYWQRITEYSENNTLTQNKQNFTGAFWHLHTHYPHKAEYSVKMTLETEIWWEISEFLLWETRREQQGPSSSLAALSGPFYSSKKLDQEWSLWIDNSQETQFLAE